MLRRPAVLLVAVLVALLLAPPGAGALDPGRPPLPGGGQVKRPNIVVLMTDDQTLESMRVMPNVQRKPFFLNVAFIAPHGDITSKDKLATPAPRHKGDFAGEPLPDSPNINEADVSDKPSHISDLPLLTEDELADAELRYQRRLESLLAVDEAVARIVGELKRTGELANTVILFVSDNGYLIGEHRLPEGKVLPYEESIRLPLIARGPGFAKGQTASAFAANIDLAPTIVDLARATARRTMDGISLVPVLEAPATTWSRDFVVESGPDPTSEDEGESDHAEMSFTGVRTERYLYVEYTGTGERELYDLATDPYELQNLDADPAYDAIEAQLAARLDELRDCTGAACR